MITEERASVRAFEDEESWSLRSSRRSARAKSGKTPTNKRRLLLLVVLLLVLLGGAFVARQRILHSGSFSLRPVVTAPMARRATGFANGLTPGRVSTPLQSGAETAA